MAKRTKDMVPIGEAVELVNIHDAAERFGLHSNSILRILEVLEIPLLVFPTGQFFNWFVLERELFKLTEPGSPGLIVGVVKTRKKKAKDSVERVREFLKDEDKGAIRKMMDTVKLNSLSSTRVPQNVVPLSEVGEAEEMPETTHTDTATLHSVANLDRLAEIRRESCDLTSLFVDGLGSDEVLYSKDLELIELEKRFQDETERDQEDEETPAEAEDEEWESETEEDEAGEAGRTGRQADADGPSEDSVESASGISDDEPTGRGGRRGSEEEGSGSGGEDSGGTSEYTDLDTEPEVFEGHRPPTAFADAGGLASHADKFTNQLLNPDCED